MTHFSAFDHAMMRRALVLAERGLYTTTPNPRVGCVLAKEQAIVGEGWHQKAGGPHAEVLALEKAGAHAADATLYVNLEPCNHHGRTPPCVDALKKSKIGRVVAAMRDPNPEAAHGGEALEADASGGEPLPAVRRLGIRVEHRRDHPYHFGSHY